jgi:hypothetical protein
MLLAIEKCTTVREKDIILQLQSKSLQLLIASFSFLSSFIIMRIAVVFYAINNLDFLIPK